MFFDEILRPARGSLAFGHALLPFLVLCRSRAGRDSAPSPARFRASSPGCDAPAMRAPARCSVRSSCDAGACSTPSSCASSDLARRQRRERLHLVGWQHLAFEDARRRSGASALARRIRPAPWPPPPDRRSRTPAPRGPRSSGSQLRVARCPASATLGERVLGDPTARRPPRARRGAARVHLAAVRPQVRRQHRHARPAEPLVQLGDALRPFLSRFTPFSSRRQRRARASGSTLTPGPIVVADRDGLHVVALGRRRLRRTRLVSSACALSSSFSAPKRRLAERRRARCPPCRRGTRSCRPSRSRTALATSNVTVPTFGFGIRPRGPRIFPRRPTSPIMSGVAMALSNSSQLLVLDLLHQVVAADEVGAGLLAPRAPSRPWRRRATRTGLAGAVRQHDRAAHVLVGLARIDAEADRELDRLVELRRRRSRRSRLRPPRRAGSASSRSIAGGRSAISLALLCHVVLIDHVEPEAARRALDRAHRRLDVGSAVRSGIFSSRDLSHLRARHRARPSSCFGSPRPLLDARGPLQQHRGGRRLGDEGEGAIGVHGDDHRNDQARPAPASAR